MCWGDTEEQKEQRKEKALRIPLGREEVGCCSGGFVCLEDACQELAGLSRAAPCKGIPCLPAIGAGTVTSCWRGFLFSAHPPELEESSSPIPLCSPPDGGFLPLPAAAPGLSTHTKPHNLSPRSSRGICASLQGSGRRGLYQQSTEEGIQKFTS